MEWAQCRSKANIDQPLKCSVERDELVVRVGVGTIAFCCKKKNGGNVPDQIKIIDKHQFAKDIAYEMEREEENGDTPLRLLLDEVIQKAMDMGSTGLSYPRRSRPPCVKPEGEK